MDRDTAPANINSRHLSRVQPETGPVTGSGSDGRARQGGVFSKQIGMNPAIEAWFLLKPLLGWRRGQVRVVL